MRLPIDLSNLSFIAGSDPSGVLDMDRRPRADKVTGELLFGLDLVVLGGEDGAEVWPVRVLGEPKGIRNGQALRVDAWRGWSRRRGRSRGATASISARGTSRRPGRQRRSPPRREGGDRYEPGRADARDAR